MYKKIAAFTTGLAMLSIGVFPVLATSDVSTTNITTTDSIAISVPDSTPMGAVAGNTLTPASTTVHQYALASGHNCASGCNTVVATVTGNGSGGFELRAQGTGAGANLLQHSNGTNITNSGLGDYSDQAGPAVICPTAEDTLTSVGLGMRVVPTGGSSNTDATWGYLSALGGGDDAITTTLAAKYDTDVVVDTSAATTGSDNRGWCAVPAAVTQIATTDEFNAAGQVAELDFIASFLSGAAFPVGNYTAQITLSVANIVQP